jgi:hypothetical protein
MGSLPLHPMELEVEQTTVDRLEDVVPPAEVDGGPTAMMEGGHALFKMV